jgi:uncharacterized phage protein gp47/JayE
MTITDLVYIDSTGYHFADYPTFLTWLQDQYKAIYGADVYLEPDSQDGQFLAVLAKAFYDTASLGGSDYNSFSPATAQGVGLSRVVKINGLQRRSPSFSTAILTLVGQAGTLIQNGIATDSLQQKWIIPLTTIPGGGAIDVTAIAENAGAVDAAPGTITTIFTPTLGWQTVTNVLAATPGAPVETDAELRIRQAQSTANPSLTVLDGTQGAVGNLAGVTKVKAYENDTGTTDGDGIPAHNICVVVAGGDDTEIANAIAVHKTPGVGTFGDVPITVHDAHGMPLVISFQRAVTATIHVVVNITTQVGWSADFIPLIKQAVADIINSGAIGDIVLFTKLYAPAYLNGAPASQTYIIGSILIGKNATTPTGANIALDFDENPVCDPLTDVTVSP